MNASLTSLTMGNLGASTCLTIGCTGGTAIAGNQLVTMKNFSFTTHSVTSITLTATASNIAITLGTTTYTNSTVANAFSTAPSFTMLTLTASLTVLNVATPT